MVEENSDPLRKGEFDQKKHHKMNNTTCLTQLFFFKYKYRVMRYRSMDILSFYIGHPAGAIWNGMAPPPNTPLPTSLVAKFLSQNFCCILYAPKITLYNYVTLNFAAQFLLFVKTSFTVDCLDWDLYVLLKLHTKVKNFQKTSVYLKMCLN